jgi:hypothetical protein
VNIMYLIKNLVLYTCSTSKAQKSQNIIRLLLALQRLDYLSVRFLLFKLRQLLDPIQMRRRNAIMRRRNAIV